MWVLGALAVHCGGPFVRESRAAEPDADSARAPIFETRIRPALVEHCYACHSTKAENDGKLKGGLKLDSAAGWKTGGDSGPATMSSST